MGSTLGSVNTLSIAISPRVTVTCATWPSACRTLSVTSVPLGPRIFSTASWSDQPSVFFAVHLEDGVAGANARFFRGRVPEGGDDAHLAAGVRDARPDALVARAEVERSRLEVVRRDVLRLAVVECAERPGDGGVPQQGRVELVAVHVLVAEDLVDLIEDGGADGVRAAVGRLVSHRGRGTVVVEEVVHSPAEPEGERDDGQEKKDEHAVACCLLAKAGLWCAFQLGGFLHRGKCPGVVRVYYRPRSASNLD
jgi:hypothetical protein